MCKGGFKKDLKIQLEITFDYQIMNSVGSNNLSLKYQRFKPSGGKDKTI